MNDIILLENTYSNLRILHYKNIIYNITKHTLVPKHTKYLGNVEKLLTDLQLSTIDQLPVIDHQDAISKILNFRQNDIIEIARPTQASKYQYVYRVVKSSETVVDLSPEDSEGKVDLSKVNYTINDIINSINNDYQKDARKIPEDIIKAWLTHINVDYTGLHRIDDLRQLLTNYFSDIFESSIVDVKKSKTDVLDLEISQKELSDKTNKNIKDSKKIQLLDSISTDDRIESDSLPATRSLDSDSNIRSETYHTDEEDTSLDLESGTQPAYSDTIYVEKMDKSGNVFYQHVDTGEVATEDIYKCEHEDKGCGFMGTYNQVLQHEMVCQYINK